MVERELDRHDAGIWNQAVRRLHADRSATCRRNSDRAALVAANRHVDFAGCHERRAARRRSARGITRLARVDHWSKRAGVAASRETEILQCALPMMVPPA